MGEFLPYVDAVIGLVATLYGFSLLVVLLVELIHRLLRLDARRMARLLGYYFERAPAGSTLLGTAPWTDLKERIGGLLDPTEPLAPAAAGRDKERSWLERTLAWIKGIFGHRLESLEWPELLERARELESWRAFEKNLGEGATTALAELQARYEQLCAQMRSIWGRYARTAAFVVGILLAVALNLNVVSLYDYFLRNPAAVAAAVEGAEALQGPVEDLVERLRADCADDAESCSAEDRALVDEAAELARSFQASLGDLPVGWTSESLGDAKFWDWMGLLAAGLLLGLGAPQLHDLLQSLLALRGRKPKEPPPATPGAGAGAGG